MQSDDIQDATVAHLPQPAASKPGWLIPLVFTLLPPTLVILQFRTGLLALFGPAVLLFPALPIFPVGAGIILGWRTGKSLPGKVLHSFVWILGCTVVSNSLLKLGLYSLPI